MILMSNKIGALCPNRVEISTSLLPGLPYFSIVGASMQVADIRYTIADALTASSYEFPPHRVTVNIYPAVDSSYVPLLALPVSMSLLAAMSAIHADELHSLYTFGLLHDDGTIGHIDDARELVSEALRAGARRIILPQDNNEDITDIDPETLLDTDIVYVSDLTETVHALHGRCMVA